MIVITEDQRTSTGFHVSCQGVRMWFCIGMKIENIFAVARPLFWACLSSPFKKVIMLWLSKLWRSNFKSTFTCLHRRKPSEHSFSYHKNFVVFFSGSTSLGPGTSLSELILSFKVYLGLDIPNLRVKSFKHSCTSGQYSYHQTKYGKRESNQHQILLSEILVKLEEPLTNFYQYFSEMFFQLYYVTTLIHFNQKWDIF